MEESTVLNEILDTLNIFGKKVEQQFKEIDKRFDEVNDKMDRGFASINQRLDRLEKKGDGMRVELTETQETTNFVLNKIAQHEKKFLELSTHSV